MTYIFSWNLTQGIFALLRWNWLILPSGHPLWMVNNKLKLNADKTEFIVIGDDQIKKLL